MVLVTAKAGEEARLEGYAAMANDYLSKPFSGRELVVRVAVQLELARLRAEAEKQRVRLERLILEAPTAIAVMRGPEHRFEVANEHFLRITRRRAGVVGMTVREAYPDLADPVFFDILDGVYRSGETFFGNEVRAEFLEGSGRVERFYTFIYQALRSADGRPEGTIVFGFDVTDQICGRRRAEEALELRERFLSTASHELRNPINTLQLYLQGVVQGARANLLDSEKVVVRVEKALSQVRRITKLVDGLLDVSRMMSGRMMLEMEEFDLAELLREAVERFSEPSTAPPIRLHAEAAIVGCWDRSRLDQVFSNLLSNAVKYGEGKPIDVLASATAEAVRIAVVDHGVGIARADQQRIFERFERGIAGRSSSGFGLGLWICNEIVAALGGSISVDSSPGEGATFAVQLPRRLPKDVAA